MKQANAYIAIWFNDDAFFHQQPNDSRFKENMERESAWILSVNIKSLLHSFRTNAGVASGLEGGYDTIKKLLVGGLRGANSEVIQPGISCRG